MGADGELVRAKRTEFSFISTKYPFVFLENNMVGEVDDPAVVAQPDGGGAEARRIDAYQGKLKTNLQGKTGINADLVSIYPYLKENPPECFGGLDSFLPRALFVAVRFQALSALVLIHFETALLLEISHMELVLRTCDSLRALSSSN
jgi:hypothetical protein